MMNRLEIQVRELNIDDITECMLDHFNRYQEVSKVWRVENNKKVIKSITFKEDWDYDEKQTIIKDLKKTLLNNGAVFGAFEETRLIGFASLDGKLIGENKEYLQLLELHVSYDSRGNGVGKMLLNRCIEKAERFGAQKLYISGHSSIETIGFYSRMGCMDAKWLYKHQVELEPYDCQLELDIK
ncbi:GNAT family N-acetyltransferase [Brassicibacter mesophilus]|uniref:GNAT family N-acetyltransferase n=1 Tax=Brassicibacter mesophilus TaxID=745119 RepID=UPI003D2224A8